MPRSPRDRSGPAQPVTISLSPRHRERLAEMAADAGTSKGVVVERLLDGGIKPVAAEPGASFRLTPGGRGDPRLKAAVDALKRGDEAKVNVARFPSPADEDLVLKAAVENLSRPLEVHVAAPSPNITAHADLALAKPVRDGKRVDPKAHVEPRLKKGGAK